MHLRISFTPWASLPTIHASFLADICLLRRHFLQSLIEVWSETNKETASEANKRERESNSAKSTKVADIKVSKSSYELENSSVVISVNCRLRKKFLQHATSIKVQGASDERRQLISRLSRFFRIGTEK